MRVFLVVITFFIIIQSFGQNQKVIDLQNHWYTKANEALSENNPFRAYTSLYFSYNYFPESEIGRTSLAKFDSVQKILRENLTKKMQGLWKVKLYRQIKIAGDIEHFYENLPGKYLEIKNDSVMYFASKKDRRKNKSLYSDQIKYCNLQTHFPSYSHIVHKDRRIWSYWVNESGLELDISRAGELISDVERTGPGSHPPGYRYIRIK